MLSDHRPKQLQSEADRFPRLANMFEHSAKEKLDLFLQGKCAFTKQELYDFIVEANRGCVKIYIPYANHSELASIRDHGNLYFWSTDDYGRRFLGEEYIKNDDSMQGFMNYKRKGHRFMFIDHEDFPEARQCCLQNIMVLIQQSNKYLDQCETCLQEYDRLFLDLISKTGISGCIVSRFIDSLKNRGLA